MIKYYVGIDPGLQGGIAIIYDNIRNVRRTHIIDMPITVDREIDVEEVEYFLHNIITYDVKENGNNVLVLLEKSQAIKGQGLVSTFNYGANYGMIKGVLKIQCYRLELINPQKWKKMFSLNNDKKRSVGTAEKLFPQYKGKLTIIGPKGGTTLRDGAAEALLLAEYGRRMDK